MIWFRFKGFEYGFGIAIGPPRFLYQSGRLDYGMGREWAFLFLGFGLAYIKHWIHEPLGEGEAE